MLEVWADQTDRLQLRLHAAAEERVLSLTDTLIIVKRFNAQCHLLQQGKLLQNQSWCNNACIVDRHGKPLIARGFSLMYPCSLLQLQVLRIEPGEFNFNPPISCRPFCHNTILKYVSSVRAFLETYLITFGIKWLREYNHWRLPPLKIEYQWVTSWYHEVTAIALSRTRDEAFRPNLIMMVGHGI